MAGRLALPASYVLDWIVVIVVAAAGGGLNYVNGFHRPFALTDTAISYPNKPDIVSLPVLIIVALVAPAAIIAVLCAGSAILPRNNHGRRSSAFRTMLWDIHVGWLGLCAGLATTLFVTSGLKDMVGKPRPDMLSRCEPDLTNISRYVVGGYGSTLDSESAPFVTSAICTQTDHRFLDDGFAAFPSGHSSFSSAGMVYLSLWLCARFAVAIPFLNYTPSNFEAHSGKRNWVTVARHSKAAPPLWQTALAFAPIVIALFICSSRYADFHHAGFDIIAGAVIGSVFAWSTFRLYHLPIRRGHGLRTWAPRSKDHAFLAHLGEEDRLLMDEERGRDSREYELGGLRNNRPERVHTNSTEDPILPYRPPHA